MRFLIINDFLNQLWCEELIEMNRSNLIRAPITNSSTAYVTSTARKFDTCRVNSGAKEGVNSLVTAIHEKVAQYTDFPITQHEDILITRYKSGQQFEPHIDFFKTAPGKIDPLLVAEGGNRLCTFMIYLNTIPQGYGGETYFLDMGLSVQPDIGKAFMWYNMNKQSRKCDTSTVHEGRAPLSPYEKWIATIWIRERAPSS